MSEIRVEIINKGILYMPVICGKMTVETSRGGMAGKAVFNVLKDENIDFTEGNQVKIYADEKGIFKGYVFTKRRDKSGIISVICYDQLRYLKNRGTYTFDFKKASDIVSIIAGDFKLETGEIEDSGFVIIQRTEDDKTLLDIIENAIDETYSNTGELFVLYDDFGKLCFKNTKNMNTDYLCSIETAENFSYESSIDKNTYTQIRLRFKGRKGIVEEYFRKNDEGISKWGILQYTGSVDEKENGNTKAESLLKLYCQKSRSLTVEGAFGDTNLRGGSIIYVNLGETGDIEINESMTVERAIHCFESGKHTIRLKLKGGLINE